ncbi:class I SAM-dependent methyltransferase [Uliginosibacterium sp. 31-12]|uniref:class I SAM-dependent methyltransferase n=1 Tax=Uliginosibacterium sp. 31-12 TaxID=3062781 RepID=UPI0026E1F7A1|nr:class I SAM-dependent methyltransferase [Uliginosibacterium sp. 31-12]MDO6386353.1 class I SAM-dependent methyltransferase [Uliginosibacterium sp. 31-12]
MQALLDAIAHTDLPTDAGRIFHGRGGLHPGCEHLSLDFYPPVWLLTSFQPLEEAQLGVVHNALATRVASLAPGQALNWIYQFRQDARAETRLMAGSVPEPHIVSEDGARYGVHLLRGLNHGFFPDMREARRWLRTHLAGHNGGHVLNLFAYTCSFSVAALQAGAARVVNVDMSPGALAIGKRNHQLNGLERGASFLPHDIFTSWGRLGREGPYEIVIVDPPSYQKGSFVAEKDYIRLLRRLPGLLAPGGHALVCLNAPKLDTAFLTERMQEAAPELEFVRRLANPDVFADQSEERALKVLLYHRPD